jgi:hypothetical protein
VNDRDAVKHAFPCGTWEREARLRTHGLIKKVGRRYKYYLTKFGRRALAASLKIREYVVLPALCADTA